MRRVLTAATLVAVCIALGSGASSATVALASGPGSGGEQPDAGLDQAVAIVESFLLARNMGDFPGAAGWCASLLELQDSDGSWFVDPPTTSDWLRQLANRYVIDPLSHPAVEGNTVSWTERLARRGIPFPEALRSSVRVPVHAVIRDGKIAYLSGPYPPMPFRRPQAAAGDPGIREGSTSAAAIPPFTLFAGSALGLLVTALLANLLGPAISNGVRRRWQRKGRHVHRCTG